MLPSSRRLPWVCLPPLPGVLAPPDIQSINGGNIIFKCPEVDDHGQVCMAVFRSRSALQQHRLQCDTGTHRYNLLSSLVLSNRCIWCNSLFASKAAAIQHVHNAFRMDHCPVDRSFAAVEEIEVVPNCPICLDAFDTLVELHRHYVLHIPQPQSLEFSYVPTAETLQAEADAIAVRHGYVDHEHRLRCAKEAKERYGGSSGSGGPGQEQALAPGGARQRPWRRQRRQQEAAPSA